MDVYARGVNVNLTPLTSNRGALATDARGCSLWRSLLERPPRAWESWVRDPLGTRYELGRCGPGRGCYTTNHKPNTNPSSIGSMLITITQYLIV